MAASQEEVSVAIALKRVPKFVSDAKRSSAAIKGIETSAKRAGTAFGSLDRSARGAFRSLASSVKYGSFALGAFATGVTIQGLKFNATLESNQVAFEGLLGSASKAHAYIANLYDLASKTPFSVTQITEGARQLLAFGLTADKTTDIMKGLGDAVALAGGDPAKIGQATLAIGQIVATGHLQGDELLQLVDAGVVSQGDLAKALGLTTQEFIKQKEAGKISSEDTVNALIKVWTTDKKYRGAAAKQAKTFNGQLSTLHDNFNQLLGKLTYPLFGYLSKTVFPRLNKAVTEFSRLINQRELVPGEKIRKARAIVDKYLKPLWTELQAWWRSNHVGDKLIGVFNDGVNLLVAQMPGIASRIAGALWSAWKQLDWKGKLITGAIFVWQTGLMGAVAGGLVRGLVAGMTAEAVASGAGWALLGTTLGGLILPGMVAVLGAGLLAFGYKAITDPGNSTVDERLRDKVHAPVTPGGDKPSVLGGRFPGASQELQRRAHAADVDPRGFSQIPKGYTYENRKQFWPSANTTAMQPIHLNTTVNIDGKEVARAVAKVVDDSRARRIGPGLTGPLTNTG